MKVKMLYCAAALCAASLVARADQLVMQNGDVYNGRLLSMDTNEVVFKSDVLGKVMLPATKVATINLGAPAAKVSTPPISSTNSSPRVPVNTQAGSDARMSAELRQIASQTNLIQQVQSQFLAGAGPEANAKFNELLNGVASGSVSMDDLRKQAKSAGDQLRAMKKDLGPDASDSVDGYLTVLDSFVAESGDSTVNTNASSNADAPIKAPPLPTFKTQ